MNTAQPSAAVPSSGGRWAAAPVVADGQDRDPALWSISSESSEQRSISA
jgi:hypothetical protein